MKSVSLGLDIGSSSIKGVLFDPGSGVVLDHASGAVASRVQGQPGFYEEDPLIIELAVQATVRSLAARAQASDLRIGAVCVTGQMHGVLVVDRALRPLTNFVSWQDRRGDLRMDNGRTYVEALRETAGEDPTGVGIHTGFGIASLYWFTQNSKIPSDGFRVLGIYDWIASTLAGCAITDITSVAAWGAFDIRTKRWKKDLLRAAKIDMDFLPDVLEPGAHAGRVSKEKAAQLGLESGISIAASIGDTQASYLGSGCTRDQVLLNFGTGSQSMWETTSPVASQATDIRYLLNNRYLVVAPTLAGGKAYEVLAGFFADVIQTFTGNAVAPENLYATMNTLAAEADSRGVTFDPLFSGSRFRPTADRASITGLDQVHFTPGVLCRALIEGMVEEIARPYYIREGLQPMHSGLIGAGNGMRMNEALREVARRRFGLGLSLSPFPEEAATGAAKLAALVV